MRTGASPSTMIGPTTRLVAAIALSSVLFSMHRVTRFYAQHFTADISDGNGVVNDIPLINVAVPLPEITNQSSSQSIQQTSENFSSTPINETFDNVTTDHFAFNQILEDEPTDYLAFSQRIVDDYQRIVLDDESYDDDAVDDSKRALVIISMGELASNTTMVERFVYSARKIGRFNGWIILITDAEEGRYSNLPVAALPKSNKKSSSIHNSLGSFISNHIGDQNDLNRFLVLRTQEERFANITKFEKFKAENTMNSKIFKTYILQYADLDERLKDIELFYYLDVDIVFGNSIRPLFTVLEERYKIGTLYKKTKPNITETKKPYIYFFKGNGGQKIQGGQFVLVRQRSQPCLERWRQLMLEQRNVTYLKDQVQLTMMIQEQRQRSKKKISTSGSCKIKLMHQNSTLIQFPELSQIKRYKLRRGKEPPVLVHFRNSANVMRDVEEHHLERYMRELLHFGRFQKDTHGILGKMLLKVDHKPKNKTKDDQYNN